MGKIRSVGVVGAGLMGRQIALAHAAHGLPVRLFDADPNRADEALTWVKQELDCDDRTEAVRSVAEVAACDLVVESVIEDAAVKRAVLASVEAMAGPQTLIATNTSSIPLAELATSLDRRERFCGLHFCHPVSERPLVEVVACAETAPTALGDAVEHVRSLGLSPLVVPDRPGFLLNRLLAPYLNTAVGLLERGEADVRAVEAAAVTTGMPVGPFTFLDAIGIDTAVRVGGNLHRASSGRLRPLGLLVVLFKAGQLGEKSGAGFFLHNHGEQPSPVNPMLERWLPRRPQTASNTAGLSVGEVRGLLWDALTTEVAQVVAEGVSTSADAWQALALGVGLRSPREN